MKKKVSDRAIKFVVEKHPDGYIAYPLGIDGVCVSQGDTYEEAVSELKLMLQSLLAFKGLKSINNGNYDIQEAFIAETRISA